MKVLCVNDKNLPEGANIVAGKSYTPVKKVVDSFGTPAYLLKEVESEGNTGNGLFWYGFACSRFVVTDSDVSEPLEKEEALEISILN